GKSSLSHLRGLELQWAKAKVLEKVLVLPIDMHGLPHSEDRSLPRGFQKNQGVRTLGQPTP
ncbi:hypothetical protein ACFLVE_04010, partial [Chloroflexota bacterium]